MASRPPFVLPIIPISVWHHPTNIPAKGHEERRFRHFGDGCERRGCPQRKPNFPERLWRAAMATREDAREFWVNGARFATDGIHIYYCASVLASNLGVKQSTVAHNIRGYLGTEKPTRMSKAMFEDCFGRSIEYRGQVWIVKLAGLTTETTDFSHFRWFGRVSNEESSKSRFESNSSNFDDEISVLRFDEFDHISVDYEVGCDESEFFDLSKFNSDDQEVTMGNEWRISNDDHS
jgi:hypothetical protein